MSKMNQFFYPPLYWQEFETLTASAVKLVFSTQSVDLIGRAGQSQAGVDVHIELPGNGVGVQCKRRAERDENNDPRPGGAITLTLLEEAIAEAESFRPTLDTFILATTAQRDAGIQTQSRELSLARRGAGLFSVKLWFWDDYVTWLNLYDPLERFYYDTVLDLRTADDHDRKLIDIMTRAFDRPAFQDSLRNEHGEAFDQALADTAHALNNGALIERRSRVAFHVGAGGRAQIAHPAWRQAADDLYKDVALLRETYAVAKKHGQLRDRNGYLEIRDPTVETFMDDKRSECVAKARALRQQAGLPPF